ncbi:MAG TPA: mannonate dehydratase [Saliniramus sp.]|nr:mannonate dehydratase [Saliniramus sp.]
MMLEQSWRWFGPEDGVPLSAAADAGASGIVTALHHIPYGEVWTTDEIAKRQRLIAENPALGLRWNVVESLPVHEAIKIGTGDLSRLFDNYRQSMRNLAACGITTICYNFMPVLDWTRTDLRSPAEQGATALRFNMHEFAAFDCLMLQREGAEADYSDAVLAKARDWHAAATETDRRKLATSIFAGLPGAFDRYDLPDLRIVLARYRDVGRDGLRENLRRFLREVTPLAEELGMRFAIHPDDPPWPLLGLPRIVGDADDLAYVTGCVASPANGITLCTGSLGAGAANDCPAIAREFAERINFVHLRNVRKDADGSFREAQHLSGDVDMIAVIDALLDECMRRRARGEAAPLPFRPDHGHALVIDEDTKHHPGYSAVGRLRGLAELRGVVHALAHARGIDALG